MATPHQRRVALTLGLVAAMVLGWCAWRWEVWAQRRCIDSLHAPDPEVRAAAARELQTRLPRLREEVLPELIAALEAGWDAPLPLEDLRSLAAGWAYARRNPVLAFHTVLDLIDVHPDFPAPNGSDFGESSPLPVRLLEPHPGLMDSEQLLEELCGCVQGDRCSILAGKLSVRAPLEEHSKLVRHLGSLRRRARLFHALVPHTEAGRASLPALERLGRHPAAPSWLRSACAHAAGRQGAATHTADT